MKNILENYKKFSTSLFWRHFHLSLAVTCFLLRKRAREMRTSVGNVAINLVKYQDFKNSFRKLKLIFVRNFHLCTLERGHSTRQKRPIDVPASNSTQVKSARLQTTNTTANIVDDCQAEECDTANQWSVGLSGYAETAASNLVQSQSNVASSPDLFVR